MRARHTAHSLPTFPVYSSAFISPNILVLGGGGGASRTGIKNKLRLYNVGGDMKLVLLDELELEKDEDAPMSMAAHLESGTVVCGVNSSTEKLQSGQNENCRLYGLKDDKLSLLGTQGTLVSGDVEDYQKVTVLSPNGNLLVVAGSRDFSLLAYPSLSPAAHTIPIKQGETYDATFSSITLVIATTVNLLVYALPKFAEPHETRLPSKDKKGKQKAKPLVDLELLQTIQLPAKVGGPEGSTFRVARFHPHDDNVLYTITNTIPPRSRKKKLVPRQAFLCKWNAETWSVVKVRKVGDRGLTCFDISPNGKLLAFGLSDYSIGLLDATSLAPLLSILKAHDFPPTTLRFNPTSTLLISGSVDNSLRTVIVPDSISGQPSGTFTSILVIFLAIILAIVTQQFLVPGFKFQA